MTFDELTDNVDKLLQKRDRELAALCHDSGLAVTRRMEHRVRMRRRYARDIARLTMKEKS